MSLEIGSRGMITARKHTVLASVGSMYGIKDIKKLRRTLGKSGVEWSFSNPNYFFLIMFKRFCPYFFSSHVISCVSTATIRWKKKEKFQAYIKDGNIPSYQEILTLFHTVKLFTGATKWGVAEK